MDELFETLTLVQTRKIKPVPIVLVGESFWRKAFDIRFLVNEGVIGLQFHLESSAESVRSMSPCLKCMEKIKKGGMYIQSINEILKKANYFEEVHNTMQILLDGIEEEYGKDLLNSQVGE